MTAFLSITNAAMETVELDIDADSAHEGEPDGVGSTERSFAGTFLSDVQHFRRFDMIAVNLFEAEYDALRALIANDAPVTIGGSAMGAAGTINGVVRITDAPYFDDARADEGHSRSAALTILEG